jgi:hypothetical protein
MQELFKTEMFFKRMSESITKIEKLALPFRMASAISSFVP